MKKSRFTEQQIAFALRQVEGGTSVREVCRKLGVNEQTFYRWKKKFAGMGVAEGRKVDFHALRHTLATNLAKAGVPQRLAMEIMRHSDPRLTAIVYTDANALPTKAAMEQLPRFTNSAEQGVQIDAQRLRPEGHEPSRTDKSDPPADPFSQFSGRNRGRE